MPKNALLPLVLWNIALSALVAWALLRPAPAGKAAAPATPLETARNLPSLRDTSALREARIAYFMMDSLEDRFDLVKENEDRVMVLGKRLEKELAEEARKARSRVQQLAAKDPTYSTKAELEADREEYEKLESRIMGLRESSEHQIQEMRMRMLEEISIELEDFLEDYNRVAGFDYILSIRPGGQIWTGNKGLDITEDVITGLNERHRTRKATANPSGKKP